jgi:hypothetical protein
MSIEELYVKFEPFWSHIDRTYTLKKFSGAACANSSGTEVSIEVSDVAREGRASTPEVFWHQTPTGEFGKKRPNEPPSSVQWFRD